MTHVRLKWPSRSTPAVLCHARVWMWQWILKMWELQPVDWLSLVTWVWAPFLLETMTIGNKHHSLGRLRPAGCMEDQLCPVVVVQSLSHAQVFATPWTAARQVSCPSLSPWACSNSCPLCRWCHPPISSSVIPSPPALNLSRLQDFFQWIGSSHQVAKVLELRLQHQYFQWIFRLDFLC